MVGLFASFLCVFFLWTAGVPIHGAVNSVSYYFMFWIMFCSLVRFLTELPFVVVSLFESPSDFAEYWKIFIEDTIVSCIGILGTILFYSSGQNDHICLPVNEWHVTNMMLGTIATTIYMLMRRRFKVSIETTID